MKKRRRKKAKSNFVLLLFLSVFIFVITLAYRQNELPFISDPFANVKKYTPAIRSELSKYHLEQYTPVLIALMQQESHGKGGDPMQASESVGLAPNTINNPNESIQLGVQHFRRALIYGEEKGVDFATIIQAYNMGIGYIDFVAQHGGKHSEQLAKNFSLLQVRKEPTIYTCRGNRFNFRYPYCYGDFSYSTKVTNNLKTLTESKSVSSNLKVPDKSF